jgi:phosphoadenosine phosphosulfate reductase
MLSTGNGIKAVWLHKKIDRSIKLIGEWLSVTDRAVYASVSGGKDSLVMADLIHQVYPDCPFVWVNQGYLAEWPDCIELLNHLRLIDWNIVELCPVRDLWHLYQDVGIPLSGKMTSAEDKIINKRLIYDPLNEYQEMNEICGYAWGIRAEESRNRSLFLKKHGALHERKDNGLWVCSPIAFWTVNDIWDYIDYFKLPYPAMYDRDRLTVRNGPAIGTTGVNWGRLAELKRYYPEYWQELTNHFPELQNYG